MEIQGKMVPKISVFIPVYRESKLLKPLLVNLLNDPYEDKEILVVIDEPTDYSLKLAKEFNGRVKFILNGERKGKANVLNGIVRESDGEILLFLDSDVQIDGNPGSFLGRISGELEDAEIVEVKKKVIRDSFLARMVTYDFLSFSFTSWLFSKTLKRCLGFHGAAFAIRRETFKALKGFRRVISEDLDMGIRSFMEGVRFKFLDDLAVYTVVPRSWGEWFKQRRRWGIGAALWLKEYFRDLVVIVRRYPKVLLPSLLLLFPFLPLLLVNLFIPDELYVKAIYVSLLLASTRTSILLPPIAFTSTSLSLLKNLSVSMGNLGIYSYIFYAISRRMDYSFNPVDFALFYFFYSPLWLLIVIISIIKVYTGSELVDVDWKI